MNPFKWKLHWQILFAILLALVISAAIKITNTSYSGYAMGLVSTCDFIGTIFMNALKMIIVPLIVSSIICGIMGLGNERNFGRMGIKILIYYTASGLLAVIVGLLIVNVIRPGSVSSELAVHIIVQAQDAEEFIAKVDGRGSHDMVNIFIRMVPPNIIKAATDNGQLLGLIVFSLLFGYFISKLPHRQLEFQSMLWESIQGIMMRITNLVIKFAPIGVFGLVMPIILQTGFELFKPLLLFFITVILALSIHFLVTLSLLLKYVGKVNPIKHIKSMAPVLFTAFSTASSASTLPVTLKTVEKNAGVSNRTASFTLPLGATINMDGTALYECIVIIFIAQIYGVLQGFEIGLATQFSVVILALLTSVGVAGIPAASLVAITVILGAVGLPIEAVGLVWVTDRVLDMCRTTINVYSDTCGAVIIGKTEVEK